MKDLSPFYIQKELDKVCGKVRNATRVRDGTLLVETLHEEQSKSLLKAKLLGSYPIQVAPHKSLNTCRGVVNTSSLDGFSDADIVTNLSGQGVLQAYRLTGKKEGKSFPMRTIFLTFKGTVLPEAIYCGYERSAVRPYVPNPMRCFQCQRFGHTKDNCSKTATCDNCGEAAHDEGACTKAPLCINCGDAHPSSFRKCPRFLEEKKIQEIRVTERLTFPEARRRFQQLYPQTTQGYAAAVRGPPVAEVSIQTVPVAEACTQTEEPFSTAPTVLASTSSAAPPSPVKTQSSRKPSSSDSQDRSRKKHKPSKPVSNPARSRSRSTSRIGSSEPRTSEDSEDDTSYTIVGPKSVKLKRKPP